MKKEEKSLNKDISKDVKLIIEQIDRKIIKAIAEGEKPSVSVYADLIGLHHPEKSSAKFSVTESKLIIKSLYEHYKQNGFKVRLEFNGITYAYYGALNIRIKNNYTK